MVTIILLFEISFKTVLSSECKAHKCEVRKVLFPTGIMYISYRVKGAARGSVFRGKMRVKFFQTSYEGLFPP